MRSRLAALIPRGRTLFWTVLLVVLGPPVLLGLMLVAAVALNLDVEVDAAKVVLASAVAILAAALLVWMQQRQRPRLTVSVGYHYKLVQPALPMGRYRFELEVFYELEQKGEARRAEGGRIEMSFRRQDHPELFDWCRSQIGTHLEQHRELVARRYPGAEVLLSSPPERVVIEPGRPPAGAPPAG